MKQLLVALVMAMPVLPLATVAQEPARPPASFVIHIESSATDVTLTCDKGCEWKTLQFPLAATPIWLDQTRLLGEDGDKVPGDGPFLLAVYANEGTADRGVDLRCKWGCRYTSWAFSPRNVPWVIDQCEVTPRRFWKSDEPAVFSFKTVGRPEGGFMVEGETTSRHTSSGPNGALTEIPSTIRTQLTVLSEEPLAPSLFEIAPGFQRRRVPFSELLSRYWWELKATAWRLFY